MKPKLNCILLIDDNEADNYLHQMAVEESACAKTVQVCRSAREALEFLKTKKNGKYPQPELVFLDINMPGMSGWDFLKEYRKLPEDQKAKIVITMLTTSVSETDREIAAEFPEISNYLNKPLTAEMVNELENNYF